ncbi:MAG: hypothetical protein ACXADY_18265 [Candidatus Hodarchaeales archaeon]|jgi:hypothetical protein
MKKYNHLDFYVLSTIGTDGLIGIVEDIANEYFDGHYTIFKFTTGYKGMWGTPDLYNACDNEIHHMRTHRVLDTLLIFLITTALKLDKQ